MSAYCGRYPAWRHGGTAAAHRHSVYDMMYAVLARRSAATVITMDRSFARRLRDMQIEACCPHLDA